MSADKDLLLLRINMAAADARAANVASAAAQKALADARQDYANACATFHPGDIVEITHMQHRYKGQRGVVDRVYADYKGGGLQYQLWKLTKAGVRHKNARLGWGIPEGSLALIKRAEVSDAQD